jgi:hypothetical protein
MIDHSGRVVVDLCDIHGVKPIFPKYSRFVLVHDPRNGLGSLT